MAQGLRYVLRSVVKHSGNKHHMNVSEFAEFWKKTGMKGAPSWKINQASFLKNHIIPEIGEKPIAEVNSMDIDLLMAKLEDKGLAGNTRRLVYIVAKKLFKYAIKKKLRIDTPIDGEDHAPEVMKTETPYLKPIEYDKLLKLCKGHWIETPIVIKGYLGPRIGELTAFRWSHVNFAQRYILITEQFNRTTWTHQTWTKGKEPRKVPLDGPLYEYLLRIYNTRKPAQDDFICLSERGKRLNYKRFNEELKNLCRRAKVTVITPHGLRHTCSEHWITILGAGAEEVRRLLGHKDLKTTQSYLHDTHTDHLRNFSRKMVFHGLTVA